MSRIYISGAFSNFKKSYCSGSSGWRDNDPHFWSSPPTWGICRTDFRKNITVGDYVFFVLPKKSLLPQMIYAYFRVKEKLTHREAFQRPNLKSKRMRPDYDRNGNIIVTAQGEYNRFDRGVHFDRWQEIEKYYVIGEKKESKLLTPAQIQSGSKSFLAVLNDIFKLKALSIFEAISRKGRVLDTSTAESLAKWVREL